MDHLPLPIHLSIHLLLAIFSGYSVGRLFKNPSLGIIAGLLGGFFIDIDHVLEYFLVFGRHFDLGVFLNGRQFLESGLIRIFFHAWEYAAILFILAWLFRSRPMAKTFVIALAVSGLVHLASDSIINNYPLKNYSLIYRYQSDFQASQLLSSEQYQKFLTDRQYFGI